MHLAVGAKGGDAVLVCHHALQAGKKPPTPEEQHRKSDEHGEREQLIPKITQPAHHDFRSVACRHPGPAGVKLGLLYNGRKSRFCAAWYLQSVVIRQ